MSKKIFLVLAACLSLSWAEFEYGFNADIGVRFLNFPEQSNLNTEIDSLYNSFVSNAQANSPNPNVQMVPFQQSRAALPVSGAGFWIQPISWLRILGDFHYYYYSDNALFLNNSDATQFSYSMQGLSEELGVALIIPAELLSMDSSRNLRVEFRRHWLSWSALNWNHNLVVGKMNPWGQGYGIDLAYDVAQYQHWLWGFRLGYSSVLGSSSEKWNQLLSKSSNSQGITWDQGGISIAITLGWTSFIPPPPKIDSTKFKKAPLDTNKIKAPSLGSDSTVHSPVLDSLALRDSNKTQVIAPPIPIQTTKPQP